MLFRSNKIKGRENTLKTLKNKIAALTIAIFFMLSLVASAALVSNAHAAGTVNIPTLAYINVAPNPCGIGQQVTVDFWLAVPLFDSERAVNMTVVETNPSGVSTTLGPFTSDITGGTTTYFTPSATGNYTFYMVYGGQQLTVPGYTNDYEEPSHSETVTLVVTSTPVSSVPFTPLPTTWWQTPVNAENVQNWYAITGPWLGLADDFSSSTGQYNATSNYNPYTTGPTTAHILWTQPWCIGGVAGGIAGGTETSDFWTTSQYEPKWAPVCMDGILIATHYTTDTDYNAGIVAWNLYNGQTLYTINTSNPLICGMQLSFNVPNQYGVVGPYIITEGAVPQAPTSDYNLYDAMTGQYVCSVVNGPPSFLLPGGFGGGVQTVDNNGNFICYFENTTTGTEVVHPSPTVSKLQTNTGPTLCMWNMTDALGEISVITSTSAMAQWSINPSGTYNWDDGLVYAAQTVPTTLNGVPIGSLNVRPFWSRLRRINSKSNRQQRHSYDRRRRSRLSRRNNWVDS